MHNDPFDNKFSLFVGKISYSVYLLHLFVIFFFVFLRDHWNLKLNYYTGGFLIYLATLLLSTVTYYVIEKPTIRLGHKLAS